MVKRLTVCLYIKFLGQRGHDFFSGEFALRGLVCDKRKDITAAFGIVRKQENESVTILWKKHQKKDRLSFYKKQKTIQKLKKNK